MIMPCFSRIVRLDITSERKKRDKIILQSEFLLFFLLLNVTGLKETEQSNLPSRFLLLFFLLIIFVTSTVSASRHLLLLQAHTSKFSQSPIQVFGAKHGAQFSHVVTYHLSLTRSGDVDGVPNVECQWVEKITRIPIFFGGGDLDRGISLAVIAIMVERGGFDDLCSQEVENKCDSWRHCHWSNFRIAMTHGHREKPWKR